MLTNNSKIVASPHKQLSPTVDDTLSICAISILAGILTNILHEGVGQVHALFDRPGYRGTDAATSTIDHIALEIPLADFVCERKRLKALGLQVEITEHTWVRWRIALCKTIPEVRMRKFLLLLLAMPLTIVAVDAQVQQKINPDCPELRYDAHFLPKLRTMDIPGFTVELLNISKVAIVVRRDRLSSSFQIERFSFSEKTWTTVVRINEQPGTDENGAVKPSAAEQNQEILNSFVLLKPGDTYSQRIQVGERLSHEQARSLGPGRYRISFYYSDDRHASAPAGRIECTPTATKEFVVHN